MRIVLVSEFGRFNAGIEQYLHDLALELGARGAEVGLVHAENGGETSGEYLAAFAWNECVPFLTVGREELRAAWNDVVQRRSPDVVYLHKLDRLEALEVFREPVRAVRMIHDHEPYCLTGRKYFFLHSQAECYRPLGMGCYPRCLGIRKRRGRGSIPIQVESLRDRRRDLQVTASLHGIVVDSRYMKRQLVLNRIPAEKISVVPTFTRPVAAPDPYPAGTRRLLFVGRLHREKGVDDFLRALRCLRPPFEAEVFGYGDVGGAARLARDLGILERVRFYGPATPGEIERAYRRAAVVVMPSKWPEPLGLVGLEAMSHGRPVVAYETGGIPDWLQDGVTGRLVPRLDVAALAAAIEALLDAPDVASEMGARGRARIVDGPFGPEAHCRRLLEILGGAAPDRRLELSFTEVPA